VTLAVLRALAERHGRLGLVPFDAHPDTGLLRPALLHGSTFRRAIEEGLIDGAPIQVGIRGPLYGPEDSTSTASTGSR
jgi:arginase family enzyme